MSKHAFLILVTYIGSQFELVTAKRANFVSDTTVRCIQIISFELINLAFRRTQSIRGFQVISGE